MIYLASPYAHADEIVMIERYRAACDKAGQMLKRGLVVYSPIAHNHPIAQRVDLPRTWEFWSKIDLEILSRCDALYVLCLTGWDVSVGVTAEIEFAKSKGLPITYIYP